MLGCRVLGATKDDSTEETEAESPCAQAKEREEAKHEILSNCTELTPFLPLIYLYVYLFIVSWFFKLFKIDNLQRCVTFWCIAK